MKYFILHSKKVKYGIHIGAFFIIIQFIFPSFFSHREIPMWPIFGNLNLRGIDSNNNNLRDDIEIRLHWRIDNDEDYKMFSEYIKLVERQMYKPVQNKAELYALYRENDCIGERGYFFRKYGFETWQPKQQLDSIIYNNKERIDKKENYVILPSSRFEFGDERSCESETDLSIYQTESIDNSR